LQILGEIPWGSHVCQFFSNGADLRETLVPYFKSGLENNERCLLVAMAPFTANEARSALRAAVGDFDRREQRGQIEIFDVRAWYNSDSVIDGEDIVAGLLASEEQARTDGYNGFRTNGNIGWVGRNQWGDFQEYERGVNRALKGRRMISMCSYCLDSCTGGDVIDVVGRHGLAITKKSDGWSCVETAERQPGGAQQNEDRQSILVRELEHRIKNNLATIQAIASSTIRNSRTMEDFQHSFTGRVAALSKTHSLLTDNDQKHVPLRELLDNELALYDDGEGRRIILSGPQIMLPAHVAVSYGMTVHELTTNALKYGALSTIGGLLEVTWTLQGACLTLNWDESNVSISTHPTRVGFGTQLLRRLLPHQLGAQVDINYEPGGLKARIALELS
jgi:two-component sensor histidine kinase